MCRFQQSSGEYRCCLWSGTDDEKSSVVQAAAAQGKLARLLQRFGGRKKSEEMLGRSIAVMEAKQVVIRRVAGRKRRAFV